ncbi:hypothetical protein KM029_14670 [Flammeovirga kamogawensis]|uniref:Gingipain domain-containing protein n=1 Tax=Flammeovirga kamogawensis TaxID=373891 RepID=A0ABX8GSK4_9BACT|nr:C25 family cysteine peptidase [Flammeovirga kamogawensis]MBB6464073.1 hypothetical protein [Flammeovirga kamogawensis]QWG06555.1 hypothetical protein KM029_14670 [Flammeovirga kamogawensis]
MDRINTWRNLVNGKRFYRMEVRENGIYRLTYSELGNEVTSQNPRNFRMFRRGQEIAIHIEGESDGSFDTGDYIEFYGEPNDGQTDRYLFRDTTELYNPYQPIYSKTAVYFLSIDVVNISTPPKRIETLNADPSGASLVTEHWYTETYIKKNASEPKRNFDLRTSFSQGESTNGSDRTSFSSSFRGPRSWTTYNPDKEPQATTFQLQVEDLNESSTSFSATLESRVLNFSSNQALFNFKAGNSIYPPFTINEYEVSKEISLELDLLDFGSGNQGTVVVISDSNTGSKPTDINQQGIMYFTLTYPQLHSSINNTDKKFFLYSDIKKKITAPSSNSSNFYNINNPYSPSLYAKNSTGGNYECVIDANNNNKKAEIYFSASSKSVSNLVKAEFDLTNSTLNYNYLIISHKELMKYEAVTSYANYRKSPTGGSNNVYIAEINKLYNTFSWGEYTPLAVRNTIDLLRNESLNNVLILGKGLDLNDDPYEKTYTQERGKHYIPTFGYPGADNAYSMGFDGNELGVVPIGRIAAITYDDIINYLQKVQEHEALEFDALWRKKALHLSGGATASQQEKFKGIIDNYSAIFIDTLEGGTVETVSRESDGVIEFVDVTKVVNQGISLMTFFGHSSAESADIDIGYASDPTKGYANQGKYPFILMSGCGGGNLFTTSKSWGEDWIETPNKGAIGFMAKSGLGNSYELEVFGDNYYEATYKDEIGKSIGYHILKTHEKSLEGNPSLPRIATVEQFGYQGDPFIKISPSKIDFSINTKSIKTKPQSSNTINSDDDFYTLDFTIDNLGKIDLSRNKLFIEIKRRYPSGELSKSNFITSITPPFNSTPISLKILNSEEDKSEGSGLNNIIIIIGSDSTENGVTTTDPDYENTLSNNSYSFSQEFVEDKVSILYPKNESVIHDSNIKFSIFDYSFIKKDHSFILEIDSDSTFFNKSSIELTGNQLLETSINLRDLPSLNIQDTTVIYARVKFKDLKDATWETISFTYLNKNNGFGWMQSDYYQMNSNNRRALNLEEKNDKLKWTFPNNKVEINVKTTGASDFSYKVTLNGDTLITSKTCLKKYKTEALIFMIFDQASGEIIPADAYWWANRYCGPGYPSVSIKLGSEDLNRSGYQGNINDEDYPIEPITKYGPYSLFQYPKTQYLKDGDYILAFCAGNFNFNPDTTKKEDLDAYRLNMEAMRVAGFDIDALKNLPPGTPFIGWLKFKDQSFIPQVKYGSDTMKELESDFSIQPNITEGFIDSSPIGPSNNFERLWINVDNSNGNIINTVQGLDLLSDGTYQSTDLYTFNSGTSSQGIDLQSEINNINQYNLIRIRSNLVSNNLITPIPPQLKNWRVSYAELPEGVIIYNNLNDNSTTRTIQQGEESNYNFTFKNISSKAFSDSLITTINYQSSSNTYLDSIVLPPIISRGEYNITYNPKNWEQKIIGETNLTFFVNQDQKQLENYINNNYAYGKMNVLSDSTNPNIEVLFDGDRIMNKDIVSPSASVTISLLDENPYLNLEDYFNTENNSLLKIYLSAEVTIDNNEKSSVDYILIEPTSFDIKTVKGQNQIIASFNINEAVPDNLLDIDNLLKAGEYTLRVEGSDVTGNVIGKGSIETSNKRPFLEVSFKIDKEAGITNIYPYPNPFSDKVKFVFQITGIEVPMQMKIQIMTVTGRVVKEIFQDELGPIRIGTNISEYAWDGKDEFGDQLANGVYLYRVIIPQKTNNEFKHIETSKDNLFKQNIGKLYLLR